MNNGLTCKETHSHIHVYQNFHFILPEVIGGSHDSFTLYTGVEVDGVRKPRPPKVQHLADRGGIQRLHRLLPGQSRLRNLDHHVLS